MDTHLCHSIILIYSLFIAIWHKKWNGIVLARSQQCVLRGGAAQPAAYNIFQVNVFPWYNLIPSSLKA